jgi:hypothetical protein
MAADPNGPALTADADRLARAADVFHDAIDAGQPIEAAARAFAPVDDLADRVERSVAGTGAAVPPPIQAAWQAFASTEVLIHQALGLDSPQPTVAVSLTAPAGGVSPVVDLADRLSGQIGAFVQAFSTNAGNVPEGPLILADAERLQAADFRQDAARGLAPNQLAYEFRDVDALSQRLVRRINRVARGRSGPNIAEALKLGDTVEQMHRVLGMPGHPPALVAAPG